MGRPVAWCSASRTSAVVTFGADPTPPPAPPLEGEGGGEPSALGLLARPVDSPLLPGEGLGVGSGPGWSGMRRRSAGSRSSFALALALSGFRTTEHRPTA